MDHCWHQTNSKVPAYRAPLWCSVAFDNLPIKGGKLPIVPPPYNTRPPTWSMLISYHQEWLKKTVYLTLLTLTFDLWPQNTKISNFVLKKKPMSMPNFMAIGPTVQAAGLIY